MTTNNQFLTDFQNSLTKLVNVRENIKATLLMREQFSNNLKSKLSQINDRLKDLAQQIANLKKSLNALENQVQANSTSVNDKIKQVE